ncbi:hypothetical protein OS493_037193 [Desmophyllum pertusum]|uniref:Pyridine nucleotide-disulphide oxidoreductase N-terminal domain-containing protein n=1 Tax=Desmophyllum pertusum TaxID=174260 RepID=A0A9W9YL72_9CNID|nr:hypothetical protein OS493_037193 [Desmophyllum pertusum]
MAECSSPLHLDSYCKVILIDPKDAFHHNMARTTMYCGTNVYQKDPLIPYEGSLKHGSFVKDRVVSWQYLQKDCGSVLMVKKSAMTILCFACGSSIPFPVTELVVIGGGAVGLELVGELATDYPSKKVTLMHNKEQILDDRMSQKFVKKDTGWTEGSKGRGLSLESVWTWTT